MAKRADDDPPGSGWDQAEMRMRLAEIAEAVAVTEDQLADTFARLAQAQPRQAARLRAQSVLARLYAKVERNRAGRFRAHP